MSMKELELAFAMMDSAKPGETEVWVSRADGRTCIRSQLHGIDELAGVERGGDTLAPLPERGALGLGRELADEFVGREAPELRERVDALYAGGGGQEELKAVLAEHGLLDAWYEFEAARVTEALREWCEQEGIAIEG